MLDLPTGATIVCTFGLVLIVLALARVAIRRAEPHAVGHEVHERLVTKATKA